VIGTGLAGDTKIELGLLVVELVQTIRPPNRSTTPLQSLR
jgi:hypothetical protein